MILIFLAIGKSYQKRSLFRRKGRDEIKQVKDPKKKSNQLKS